MRTVPAAVTGLLKRRSIHNRNIQPELLRRNRGQTFSAVQMTEAASRLPMPQASAIVLP